jgi:aldose sugar dehydrogenase
MRQARAIVWLAACIAVSACGSGDADPPDAAPGIADATAQSAVDPQFASTATPLPQPVPAETPTHVGKTPPAPKEGTDAWASPAGSKLSLDRSLGMGLIAPSIMRRTVVGGLKSPTGLAFTDDGVLFYTEREQGLFAIKAGGDASLLFALSGTSAHDVTALLAVAVDPDFARNRFVYALIGSRVKGTDGFRIIRLAVDASATRVMDEREILAPVAPLSLPEEARNSGRNNGSALAGTMRFGPDGYLYVGLTGRILRIDRSGAAAPANRAPAGTDSRIYASGLHDPAALAFHGGNGTLFVGQRQGALPDDITPVQPGSNAASVRQTSWRTGKPDEGLSGMERLRGSMWGEWRNAFVVAFDRAQRLDLVKFDAEGQVVRATPALQKVGVGFKAVAQGPDGLYVVTSGRPGGEEIWRLSAQ